MQFLRFSGRPAGWLVLACLLGFHITGGAQQHLPTTVCGPGESVCRGRLGGTCYMPARGETCTAGQVCGAGQRACSGRFGTACYGAAMGETCTQGLICGTGQLACIRGANASCYMPARGESCR